MLLSTTMLDLLKSGAGPNHQKFKKQAQCYAAFLASSFTSLHRPSPLNSTQILHG